MKKCLLFLFAAIVMLPELKAQIQTPGLDVLGFGYDVFGNYADQKSKKRYCLFKYGNFETVPIGSEQYNVPKFVFLENISDHLIKTVSGESIRDYAQSLSVEAGLGVDAMFFKGSIDATYSTSVSGTEQKFFYTYMDANIKWRVSFDERDLPMLKTILDPRFKADLATMPPAKLFELYGTHYIASAYLGGRADFTSVSTVTEKTTTQEIGLAVEAQYKAVTANVKTDAAKQQTLRNANTKTSLRVTGGLSQYANNISNPETYNLWASGIERMPVLADFDSNSLKPIWDFCEDEGRRNQLQAEFDRMCKANPLPKEMVNIASIGNRVFYIKSVAHGTFWDLSGYHFYAQDKGGKIKLYEKDMTQGSLQGADRFIKVIPHATKPEFVYFQPQHSDYVADIIGGSKNAGAEVQLFNQGTNVPAQLFKMIRVDGVSNTYYIQNEGSGLFLTANAKTGNITQEAESKSDNQKWLFEKANPEIEMAPPSDDFIFAFQNVKAKRFLDFGGTAPKAQSQNGAKLQLWDMDYAPDRYYFLHRTNDSQYFLFKPMHTTKVLEIAGGVTTNGTSIQLYDRNNTQAQTFKFVYAGEPMTYYIINRGSKKALDASDSRILQNGCPVQIWDFNRVDNQKWKMTKHKKYPVPDKNLKFVIKAAYINKYIDLPGDQVAANRQGNTFQLWDLDSGHDRVFQIIPSGDNSWVGFQVQNGGRYMTLPRNSPNNRERFILHDKTNLDDQKFAILFTSPTTFVFVTRHWKALDAQGGKDEYNKNGTALAQWDLNYNENQQFQLIYWNGPNKGKPYHFTE